MASEPLFYQVIRAQSTSQSLVLLDEVSTLSYALITIRLILVCTCTRSLFQCQYDCEHGLDCLLWIMPLWFSTCFLCNSCLFFQLTNCHILIFPFSMSSLVPQTVQNNECMFLSSEKYLSLGTSIFFVVKILIIHLYMLHSITLCPTNYQNIIDAKGLSHNLRAYF